MKRRQFLCLLALFSAVFLLFSVNIGGRTATAATEKPVHYTLNDLLQLAESNSPQLKSQLFQLEKLRLDLANLQVNYYPKLQISTTPLQVSPDLTTDQIELNANGTLSATWKLPIGLELSTGVNLLNLYDQEKRDHNFFLTAKAPIFPGLLNDSMQKQIAEKKNALKKADLELIKKRTEVALQVTKKFYATLILQEKLSLAETNNKEAEADLKLYRDFQARGDATQSDLLNKEITFQSSQVNLLRAQQQYSNSLKELLAYAGIAAEKLVQEQIVRVELEGIMEQLSTLTIVKPEELPAFSELLSKAIENNAELKAAKLDLNRAEDELGRNYTAFWPEVNTQFQYKQDTEIKNVEKYNWALQLSLSYDLFDGGKRRLALQEQKQVVEEQEQALKDVSAQVDTDLTNKLASLKLAYLELRSTELDLLKAKLDRQNKNEQFKKGLISRTQMADSEQACTVKELDYLQKKVDYLTVYWDLYSFVYAKFQPNEVVK